MRSFAFTASATALLAGCAATPAGEPLGLDDPRVGGALDRVCFNRQISGFTRWDEGDGLILRRGVRDEVLATLRVCPSADFAQRVGVDARFGGGCLRPGDRLFVSTSAFGGGASADPLDDASCLIDGLYAYDPDATGDASEDAGE